MLSDQFFLLLTDQMLAAGVEEIKTYDPEQETQAEAVSRIYFTMERALLVTTMMLEQRESADGTSRTLH